MAYVRVHSIKRTLSKSLKYIKNKDKVTFVGEKNDLADAMKYATNPAKTIDQNKEFVFVEGWMCDPQFAEAQFGATKEKYLAAHGGKERNTTGTSAIAWHLIQSFPQEVRDPYLVHQIGMEFAENVGDYQAVVSTHVQGSNCMHNHIIFNAYPMNAEYGHKYHRTVEEYRRLKQVSDDIGLKYGIQPIQGKDIQLGSPGMNIGERNARQQGKSWKEKIRQDISEASKTATGWDDLKKKLTDKGYKITEHQGGYVSYLSPYAKKAIRDTTLGEQYTKDFLNTLWDAECKKKYDRTHSRKATLEDRKHRKDYEAIEQQRWREAQRIANRQPRDKGLMRCRSVRVSYYDETGRRRSNLEMLILIAVKTIELDITPFQDPAGAVQNYTSPIYAPRDWKIQRMLDAATMASRLGITEQGAIPRRKDELNQELRNISIAIRKKKIYMNKREDLVDAINVWRLKKSLIEQYAKLPESEKGEFKEKHRDEFSEYNKAVSIFYKFSKKTAKTPIIVYDSQKKRRIVSEKNVESVIAGFNQANKEIEELTQKRNSISREISQIRTLSVNIALANDDFFVYGPKFSEEKLAEIDARAAAAEKEILESQDKMEELQTETMGKLLDDMFAGSNNNQQQGQTHDEAPEL